MELWEYSNIFVILITLQIGEFFENYWHGKGKYSYLNGDVYIGDFNLSIREGKGIYTYIEGDVYSGDWVNAQKHGQGTIKYADGEAYQGEWVYDKRCGKGTNTFPNGDVFDGTFCDDVWHGLGKFIYGHKSAFVGGKYDLPFDDIKKVSSLLQFDHSIEFIYGKKNGLGVFIFANGAVYEGALLRNINLIFVLI